MTALSLDYETLSSKLHWPAILGRAIAARATPGDTPTKRKGRAASASSCAIKPGRPASPRLRRRPCGRAPLARRVFQPFYAGATAQEREELSRQDWMLLASHSSDSTQSLALIFSALSTAISATYRLLSTCRSYHQRVYSHFHFLQALAFILAPSHLC